MEKTYEIKSPGKTNIVVNGGNITIERKGLLNAINIGSNASKTLRIKSINSVQIKKPGLSNGYIQFGVSGDGKSRRGVMEATQDENTVMFAKKHYQDMLELQDYINSYEESSSGPVAPASVADELYKLKKLLDDGIITEEEFAEMKTKAMK